MPQLGPEGDYANRYQLVSRMADDIAHELKNPLNSMVINLEVLRSRAKKGDAEGVLGRADVLEQEVRRLNALIDGVLKLLRPDRNGDAPFAIDTLLEEIGGLVGVQAKLARKQLDVHPIGESALATGRDAVRFALLNILAVELQLAHGDEARVQVGGTTSADGTLVRIESPSTAAGGSGARDAALNAARGLLRQVGGDVNAERVASAQGAEPAGSVVVVALPPIKRA